MQKNLKAEKMDASGNIQLKPKRVRVRSNPTRKWMPLEEKGLIDFLLENREFEKPTSQAYYRRFAEETSIPVEWKLVRAKVRNMRMTYNKAKAWMGSTEAGSMEGETIKKNLLKMCSFFDAFDEIFGGRIVESAVRDPLGSPAFNNIFNSTKLDVEEFTITSESSGIEPDNVASTSRRSTYSRVAVSDIMQMQSEMMKLKKQKMDQDFLLKEKEIKIKEREVLIKEKETELKELEFYSQEKLKLLELEMKERLAMEELKHKYK